jgi:phosphatidylserine/phosphatidylglycerophosphate/cardiolipin synthase-like enzyme
LTTGSALRVRFRALNQSASARHVKRLIASAQHTLFMQFQYIELPKTPGDASAALVDLVAAVVARQQAGVDVKIIMSQYETAGYLELLQAAGLDVVNRVKLQNNVHNKGIVVDGRTVLVSSQNWSTAGTSQNRDAGVIIHNAHVAEYFQAIFQHDWDHLAQQHTTDD